jgi:predicted ATPase/DNA-binding SARP family transcriptional activator
MLEVRLIGAFEIKCDGEPVAISSRAAQSLFAYLILTAGISHRREKLAGMFWPDVSEEKARAYLRHELWRIRKSLSSKSKIDYLLADGMNVSFNSSADYWSDVAQLRNIGESASVDDSMDTLSVFQGDLLPGFYEDWITQEREHLQTVYEQQLARLLEMLEKEQRWHEMVEWAERSISLERTSEAPYRALMVAFDSLGDRPKAAESYERCIHALRELGLEPSEGTRALAFKRTSKLNIPIPLTSFVGREKELQEVADLLSKSRLVTLTGSGGVGKTRLAIQVVADVLELFPDGVWFLDLAPLTDPTLVPNALANILGLHESVDTKLSISDLLVNYFRSRTALVIFDNCEHLIEACAQLVNLLLTSCEKLSVLATSREALRVPGEVPYRVPSLKTPVLEMEQALDEIVNLESVRLFKERAALVSPTFAITPQNVLTIGRICQRLDGIPLAIELATARVNVLNVEQILQRLDDRFNLLTAGIRTALPRQQTLRATIEWSYGLLSEKERVLFRRLAVFMGGWTLDAAEMACQGEEIKSDEILNLLYQLVNKSIVIVQDSAAEPRYRRLESIRQYAHERLLESGEQQQLRSRHLKYFLQLSEQAETALRGPTQIEWMSRLKDERDNIRAALEWAEKTDVEAGLYISGRLHSFWESFDIREGERWLAKFIENPESKLYPLARAKALLAQGWCLQWLEQFDACHSAAQECLEIYRSHDDAYGEIDAVELLALTVHVDQAMDLLNKALMMARALGDLVRQSRILVRMSWHGVDLEQRKSLLKQAINLLREVGDLQRLGILLNLLAHFELWGGHIESAQTWLEEAVQLNKQLNHMKLTEQNSGRYGQIEYLKGNFQQARLRYQESLTIAENLGYRMDALWYQTLLGYVATQERNVEEAKKHFRESVTSFQKDQSEIGLVYTLEGVADLHVVLGHSEAAARLVGWADAMRMKLPDNRPPMEQRDIDRIIADCIAAIGEVGFASAYEEGKNMTLDEAIAYAFDGV